MGPIAYGCWRLAEGDLATARANLEVAVEAGLDLIDTADVYGLDSGADFGSAEKMLGRVLADAPALRDRIVLATKGGIVPGVPYDSSATALTEACDASLKRLGVDHLDLYQVHRPDLLAHPAEVAEVLTALRTVGKVREVGLSNVTVSQFETLQHFLDFPLAVNQVELSLWHPAPLLDGTADHSLRTGVVPLAWSPLGGGAVAGTAPVTDHLRSIAAEHSVDPAELALAFVLAHPSRPIPIVGTQRVERVRASMRALDVEIDRPTWYRLLEGALGTPLP